MRVRSRFLAALGCLCLAASPAFAAWPHDPAANLQLASSTSNSFPRAVPDGAGGAIVGYYRVNPSTGADVYVQRIDRSGRTLWTPGGVPICVLATHQTLWDVAPDGLGGILLVWVDDRNGPTQTGIYAQRVDGDGNVLWTANGVPVCNLGSDASDPAIASDGAGGAVIAWMDHRNVATLGTDIYYQRLSSTGANAHVLNGVAVCSTVGTQRLPQIVLVSATAIVAWEDLRSGTTDLYIGRMSSSGAALDGLGDPLCNAAGTETLGGMAVAPGGGWAVVTWEDDRSGSDDVYAQLYSSSPAWTANGRLVCGAIGGQIRPDVCADDFGNIWVGWSDYRGLDGIYLQKLDLSGAPGFTTDGILVRASVYGTSGLALTPDLAGGVVACWSDNLLGVSDVHAQRVSSAGTLRWGAQGTRVSVAPGSQQSPNLVADGTGGAIIVWDDLRTVNRGAYAQGVDAFGYLGGAPVISSVRDVANDQGGQLKVSWVASELEHDPAFRNVSRYDVFRSVPTSLVTQALRAGHVRQDLASVLADPKPGDLWQQRTASQDYFWEFVGSRTPSYLSGYSMVVPTAGDSVAGSNPLTAVLVVTVAAGPDYIASDPDSGYSVDDLAPLAPAPFYGTFAGGTASLHWDANTEADLAGYRVYRGTTPGFTPSPANRIGTTSELAYDDAAGAPYWYKLTAVDVHGNESPATPLRPAGTLDATGGEETRALSLALHESGPARLGRGVGLRFALPAAGHATLRVHDAQGRAVRTLARGEFAAGEHDVRWDARDEAGHRVSPGVWFVRLESATGARVVKVAALD